MKQKHKEKLEDKAKVESPNNNDNQTPVSYVQTTEFDDIEGTKQFDCLLCDKSYAKAETLEKHISEVHRQKSNVQLEGIFSNDQTNESKPPEAKKTKLEFYKCHLCQKMFKRRLLVLTYESNIYKFFCGMI